MVKMSEMSSTADVFHLPMSFAKDEDFRQVSFELQEFGIGLFKGDDSIDFMKGFKELPKVVEDSSFELNYFFDIFDVRKKKQSLDFIEDNGKIDFIGSKQRLLQLFDDLDDQYFNGMLNHNKIMISWCPSLQKDKTKVDKKCGKIVTIKVSSKLFKNGQVVDLVSELLKVMSKAYMQIMEQTISFGKSAPKVKNTDNKDKPNPRVDTVDKTVNRKCWCTKWIAKRAPTYSYPYDIYIPINPKLDLSSLMEELDDKLFIGVLGYNDVEVIWGDRMMVVPGITYDSNFEHPVQIRLSRQLLNGPRNRLIEALLFQMIRAFMFINKIDWNETEFGKVLARIQRFSKTSIEFNLSLVYEPEDYLRLLIELHNAKQKVANKRRETRRRIFAK